MASEFTLFRSINLDLSKPVPSYYMIVERYATCDGERLRIANPNFNRLNHADAVQYLGKLQEGAPGGPSPSSVLDELQRVNVQLANMTDERDRWEARAGVAEGKVARLVSLIVSAANELQGEE